ncbi:unnamed protein product [Thlaspi arvense]|uniref:Bifunctional inhibitor/plant lipid transfer protein/seed storage helical domain-containing protein n=1 Tax=Thlaspi arvense TaxID=13288 RepID=A0AAU9SCZ7_THLAR|nr:unnamed protein product [Thlaspi arvense]
MLTVVCIAFVILAVSYLATTKAEEKVECNPVGLRPCLPAVVTGVPPSTECCGNLKQQESALNDSSITQQHSTITLLSSLTMTSKFPGLSSQ